MASSISEWIVATIFCFYILTFTDEFRNIAIDHPVIVFVNYSETVTRFENDVDDDDDVDYTNRRPNGRRLQTTTADVTLSSAVLQRSVNNIEA